MRTGTGTAIGIGVNANVNVNVNTVFDTDINKRQGLLTPLLVVRRFATVCVPAARGWP